MLARARLYVIATGGLIAFALATGYALSVQAQVGQDESDRQTRSDENQTDYLPWTVPVEIVDHDKSDADARKRREEQADQREVDDLLAQQGMNEATGRMADLAEWQTLMVVIGTGLLFATLGFTYFANRAAFAAAKHSKTQADIAEATYSRLERPYLYVYGVGDIERDGYSDKAFVKYTVANFGRTPAAIRILAPGINAHPDTPESPRTADYLDDPTHDLLMRPVLPPDDVRPDIKVYVPDGIEIEWPTGSSDVLHLVRKATGPKLATGDQFFLWIRIQYRGPLGDGYMTDACWRYDRLTNRFVQWGEKEGYTRMT